MSKLKTTYECQQCSATSAQWRGQCLSCGTWNSLILISNTRLKPKQSSLQVQSLASIEGEQCVRRSVHHPELDRILGGGLVEAAVVLLGGDPGIGKSTLVLQVAAAMSRHELVIYITGEESLVQLKLRAVRLQVDKTPLQVVACTDVDEIIALMISLKPRLVIIDSIQTLHSKHIPSASGSVVQVRYATDAFVNHAKSLGVSLFLVGHVTKEGAIAGPKLLEHMVDVVMYFEGESDHRYRGLRAYKNRFGPVQELALFAMTDRGLQSVDNPSNLFLNPHNQSAAGSVITACVQGARPLLLELQILTDQASGQPRRLAVGIDPQRLQMLIAVLHQHLGASLQQDDVYLNLVGGLKLQDPAMDLAIAVGLLSSIKRMALPKKLLIFGEVGLVGEIRPVSQGQVRLHEAKRHGFTHVILPARNKPPQAIEGLSCLLCQNLAEVRESLQDLWLTPAHN